MPRKKSAEGGKCAEKVKTFSEEELLKFQEVQTWLRTVGERSRIQYIYAIKGFCNFCGKDPKELILERDNEIKNSDPNNRTGIRDLILDFRKYMEKEDYAPKSINARDGAIRGFFSSVLGRAGMVNVKNYGETHVVKRRDLIPTLEEVKKMIDVVSIEEKARIIFIAQTGMRVSDALELKVGNIKRELDLGNVPLAIRFLPKKDRDIIKERITFLASDGIEILKQYLEWRKKNGEKVTSDSPLFVSRSKRGIRPVTPFSFNQTIKGAAKKVGLNGDNKYGTMRTHGLRKFFITQLTNHGVEDKILNFFICHKIPDIDRVYWFRRVESLRTIYAERQQYLNPINGKKHTFDLKKLEGITAMVKDMDARIDKLAQELKAEKAQAKADSKIVATEKEVIELSNQGYGCQPIGENKWLMRRGTKFNA